MAGTIRIGAHDIGDHTPCYVIAEIGHNHQGSLEKARELFREAKQAGAHSVKLQKRDNRGLYTRAAYNKPYDNENSFGATYGEHREFLEFGAKEYRALHAYAKELGIDFFSTAFDLASAAFLAGLERRPHPQVQRIHRLHVVMAVDQHCRCAWGVKPVGIHDGMPGGLRDLNVLQAPTLQPLREKRRSSPHVRSMLAERGDARDPQEVEVVREALRAGVGEERIDTGQGGWQDGGLHGGHGCGVGRQRRCTPPCRQRLPGGAARGSLIGAGATIA